MKTSSLPLSSSSTTRATLLGLVVSCVFAAAACGGDPPSKDMGGADDMSEDMVTGCTTSAECTGDDAGKLCVAGSCVACVSDAECADDAATGDALPYCVESVCQACADGKTGCACEADGSCDTGECIADVCVDCERGEIDCVCLNNGSCSQPDSICGEGELCRACEPGEQDCPCDPFVLGSCGDGLECVQNVCVPDDCVAGSIDCPCDAGACTDGDAYCNAMDVCKTCSNDVAGCACDGQSTCEGDLYCDDADTCQECGDTDRPEGCECDAVKTCADELVCDPEESACREPLACADLDCDNQACTEGVDGEDATCVVGTCVDGYVWDGAMCIVGTGTSCTNVDGSLTQEAVDCINAGKTCVDSIAGHLCVDTCQTLDCQAQNQDCQPGTTELDDAVCGACEPGYTLNNNVCVADTAANCAPNDPDSIAALCTARGQECAPDAGGNGATCGDCLSGLVFDQIANACIEKEFCGLELCTDEQFCFYPKAGGSPSCRTRCADNEAYDEDTDSCTTCSIVCAEGLYGSTVDGQCACTDDVFCQYQYDTANAAAKSRCFVNACADGEAEDATGTCTPCQPNPPDCGMNPGERTRVWPIRSSSGQCICETQQGYYQLFGMSGAPAECDADGDGWVNDSANDAYLIAGAGNPDTAVLGNFRCDRRVVDRVKLVNEYGQRRYLAVCAGASGNELFDWAPGGTPPAECVDVNGMVSPTEFVLKEPNELDSDSEIGLDDTVFPLYGSRKLKASEVNAMTKACISSSGDYNANGVNDYNEEQALALSDVIDPAAFNIPNPSPGDFIFAASSYFLELHNGYYVQAADVTLPGEYVVEERSRCDDVALAYQVGDGFYHESCYRRRDSGFDEDASRVGYDFAYWSCSGDGDGSCELPAPDVLTTGADLNGDNIADHGLCALDAANKLPLNDGMGQIVDEPWLGMNHHSQFRCGKIEASSDLSVGEIGRDTVRTPMETNLSSWDYSVCEATDCSQAAVAGCVETTSQTIARNPTVAQIECEWKPGNGADSPTDGDVGFFSARYINYGPNYIRGCVNESAGTIEGNVNPIETLFGWSRLCDGFLDSGDPGAFLTAGNRGNFGELICSCNENYGGVACEYACAADFTLEHVGQSINRPAANPGGSWSLHVGAPLTQLQSTELLTDEEKSTYQCGDDGFCLSYPPVNENGINFQGGQRGFWMCGDFSLTRPADPNSTDPWLAGTAADGKLVESRGRIATQPVVRTPSDSGGAQQTVQSAGCANGGECFELF